MIYGYARVSTDGQSVDTQVRRLRAVGARRVFREVASGIHADRPQLRRAIGQLEEGDVLLVIDIGTPIRSMRLSSASPSM
jgi:DNA invertase Pin-like site-specific DNA recombinase